MCKSHFALGSSSSISELPLDQNAAALEAHIAAVQSRCGDLSKTLRESLNNWEITK